MAVDERIRGIKIAVHNEEESRKVQEKLFELGADETNKELLKELVNNIRYYYVDFDGVVTKEKKDKKFFDKQPQNEIYVEDLLAMEKKEEISLLDKINSAQGTWLDTALEKEILQTKEEILSDFKKLCTIEFDYNKEHLESLREILNKRIGK